MYFHLIIANLWACVLRKSKGRIQKAHSAGCLQWGPSFILRVVMCPSPVYPCLLVDLSALHSAETQNFPAKVMCLATSVILAVGRREQSTKQKEGNNSIQPAWPRNTGSLPGPTPPETSESLSCPVPQLGWALLFLPVPSLAPHQFPEVSFLLLSLPPRFFSTAIILFRKRFLQSLMLWSLT